MRLYCEPCVRQFVPTVLFAVLCGGCPSEAPGTGSPSALGDDDGPAVDDDAWPPPTTGVFTTGGLDTEGEGDEDPTPPAMPPDLGACSNDGDCTFEGEQDTCFITQGACEFGQCFFDAKSPGSPCDDGDPCTEDEACNGMGGCLGAPVVCTVEHGEATCTDGACEGPLECEAGWGDCDDDASNGCEANLESDDHCGACNEPCAAGPHVEATSCDAGTCTIACEDPWEDCNGDLEDGCEIPTGVPNQCDSGGLNADNGCWSAHCGRSSNPDAVNFDGWFCFECTTCQLAGDNQCQWCSHSTGRWFPTNSCDCADTPDDCLCVVDEVNYLNQVCEP